MFCYVEGAELVTNICPAKACIYQNKVKQCAYKALTPDLDEGNIEVPVTALSIAREKNVKLYKVKEQMARAKLQIKLGLAILHYSEYLKTLVQVEVIKENTGSTELGYSGDPSKDTMSKVSQLLMYQFGLGQEHQTLFFDQEVFNEWKANLPEGSAATSENLTLTLCIDALKAVVSR